jgi:hypothetical protein
MAVFISLTICNMLTSNSIISLASPLQREGNVSSSRFFHHSEKRELNIHKLKRNLSRRKKEKEEEREGKGKREGK